MTARIHYDTCPVCHAQPVKTVLKVKDHTVSGETFDVAECSNCGLRFTQDVPGTGSIAPYYKSEDYISHTDTSKGFVNRLYHAVRKRTIVQKRKLIEQMTGLKAGSLLDVGSGTGAFLYEMKQHGWQATGLEPDGDARQTAGKLYGLQLEDADRFYELQQEQFDAITLWHVLEHVHDLSLYVQQLRKLLKPSGLLFIAVPNYTSLDAAIYRDSWAAYDVPRHLYHFSPKSMEVLMEKHQLKIREYKPMWYDSFYICLLSSKYRHGSTNWLAAAWNGLRSNLAAVRNAKRCSSVIYVIAK